MSKVEQIEENLKKLKELGVAEGEIIERCESKILSLKNGELSYVFIKNIKDADVKAHGKVVIESKDPELNYYFVKNVKGADVMAHGKVVIESKNAKWNYKFARFVEGADIKAHEKVVIESKDPEFNFYFLRYVEGADIIAHGQVIIESKDSIFNRRFKEDFEDEYKILKRNNLIDDTYNFLDDALDEMIKENNEENKSMQKRF